jgi:rare lipoprotein A
MLMVLPLLTACAVVGYPSSQPVPAPQASSAPASAAPAQPSEPVIIRPAPAPITSAPLAAVPATPPRTYEVLGERYVLLDSAEGYAEEGVASWYGSELAGRPTSSGEPYDPQELTAAHRSLPFSSWIEVTNLDNGHSVVLRVNDRGPFAETDERIVDVSYAAARLLGMVRAGLALVSVKTVPPPPN